VGREALCHIVTETHSKTCVAKYLCDAFYIQDRLKQDAISPLIFNFALE